MKVGFICAFGPGQGHRSRCDALRNGLLAAGHEIVSAFIEVDWLVIDDPEFFDAEGCDAIFDKPNVLLVLDDEPQYKLADHELAILPFKQPHLAWVRKISAGELRAKFAYCQMGMSPQGRKLQDQVSEWLDVDNGPLLGYDGYDICIGAPGVSSWERCTIGQPTAMIVWTPEQALVAQTVCDAGAGAVVWNMLTEGEVDESVLKRRLSAFCERDLAAMGRAARKLCDGKGVERTIKLMEERCEI